VPSRLAGYPSRAAFRGRTLLLGAVHGHGVPVVAGLWSRPARAQRRSAASSRHTKQAMLLAQIAIALPLVVGFTSASIQALGPGLFDLIAMLGVSRLRAMWILAREARLGLLAAIMAGFGAVISEVGASMMVGGNLQGDTRVLTTAIVTETSRGQTERAIALGVLLMALAFAVNLALTSAQQRRAR
jgi:tungstate transport system permease protein